MVEDSSRAASYELLELLQRQFRVSENLPDQPAADRSMVRDGNRSLPGAREAYMATSLAHLAIAAFGQRLNNFPTRKNAQAAHTYQGV